MEEFYIVCTSIVCAQTDTPKNGNGMASCRGGGRANATKKYLVSLGVSVNRISTTSYGKVRSLDSGDNNEEAWVRNLKGS